MLQAKSVLAELVKLRVTHILGLPDNASAALFDRLGSHHTIRLLTVTREAEAFAVAAGLWIGGKTPAVLIQNTGFLESGDSFRGTVKRMRIPLLCFITYRGYTKMSAPDPDRQNRGFDEELLSRADVDSAALMTEPTLQAWQLPYHFLKEERDVGKIAQAFAQARANSAPVVLLVVSPMA